MKDLYESWLQRKDRKGSVMCKGDSVRMRTGIGNGYKYGIVNHFHSNDYGDKFVAVKVDGCEWPGCTSYRLNEVEVLL